MYRESEHSAHGYRGRRASPAGRNHRCRGGVRRVRRTTGSDIRGSRVAGPSRRGQCASPAPASHNQACRGAAGPGKPARSDGGRVRVQGSASVIGNAYGRSCLRSQTMAYRIRAFTSATETAQPRKGEIPRKVVLILRTNSGGRLHSTRRRNAAQDATYVASCSPGRSPQHAIDGLAGDPAGQCRQEQKPGHKAQTAIRRKPRPLVPSCCGLAS